MSTFEPAAKKRTLEEMPNKDDYAHLKDLAKKINQFMTEAEDDNDLGKKVRQLMEEFNKEEEQESDKEDDEEETGYHHYQSDEEKEINHLDFGEERGYKRVQLETSCRVIYEVDRDIASKCELIKQFLLQLSNFDDYPSPIPLSLVNGTTLLKILEYCHKYRHLEYKPIEEDEDRRIELTDWDKSYLDIRFDELQHLLAAAEFLIIPGLMEIIIQKIVDKVKGMTVEDVRYNFGLYIAHSAEEEERFLKAIEAPLHDLECLKMVFRK